MSSDIVDDTFLLLIAPVFGFDQKLLRCLCVFIIKQLTTGITGPRTRGQSAFRKHHKIDPAWSRFRWMPWSAILLWKCSWLETVYKTQRQCNPSVLGLNITKYVLAIGLNQYIHNHPLVHHRANNVINDISSFVDPNRLLVWFNSSDFEPIFV